MSKQTLPINRVPVPAALNPIDAQARMTEAQTRTAYWLASSRGHGWTTHGEDCPLVRRGDCAALRRREAAQRWPGLSPAIASDGGVWHESSTGRTVWRVDADGSARIWLRSWDQDAPEGKGPWELTVDFTPSRVGVVVAAAAGVDMRARVREGLYSYADNVVSYPDAPLPRPLRDDRPVRRL